MTPARVARLLIACLALGAGFARAADDVVELRNGDRISGKIVFKGTKLLRLQTAYGVLQIGIESIQRLKRADGSVEEPGAAKKPGGAPSPKPAPLRLVLVVTGKTFWQAWDAANAPADASLRLDVQLDEKPLVAYGDSTLDEGEIPKAVVNSFSFTPDSWKLETASGVKALPPEVKPGRIQLPLEVPPALAGSHRLRLAYQANAASRETPEWHDLAQAEIALTLRPEAETTVLVEQDRGSMEFAKKRMKAVESFVLALKLDTAGAEP